MHTHHKQHRHTHAHTQLLWLHMLNIFSIHNVSYIQPPYSDTSRPPSGQPHTCEDIRTKEISRHQDLFVTLTLGRRDLIPLRCATEGKHVLTMKVQCCHCYVFLYYVIEILTIVQSSVYFNTLTCVLSW